MDTNRYRSIVVVALIVILCFTLGFIVGYFSMKNDHLNYCKDEYANDADSAKFDNLNKGPDNSISKKIPGLVSRQRLDETLRFLTEKPRYAGTENQADVTNFVHNTFLKHGFYSERVSYNVLLSYPLPAANTTVITFHPTSATLADMYTMLPCDKINDQLSELIKWCYNREGKTYICTSESKGFFSATEYKSWTYSDLRSALPFLLDNIYITLLDDNGNELYQTSPYEEDVEGLNADNNDDSFKAFNAFSPSGVVEGDFIYAGYARKSDFEKLKDNEIDVTGKIVIAKYGKIFRGNKVDSAAKAGAVGVILYSDPADYGVCCEGINPYPKSAYLPLTGIQRGNVILKKGDQTTPGYPSTKYGYRMNEDELKVRLPSIPSQPIAANDAFRIIREMNGQNVEQDSLGRFNLSFPYGTGLKPGRRIKLHVQNINEMRTIENVIGTVKGSIEPDRYVIFGGHKDAYVYGAADPMSGTNVLLEVSRVIGELIKQGWRPRRSIIICSWDAEEYGLVGSYEWVEENMAWIRDKVVTYINVDIPVSGNMHIDLNSVPLLKNAFVESTKIAADPKGEYNTVYDKWLDEENGDIKAWQMGGGSDFVPFLAVNGIPCLYPAFYGISSGESGPDWNTRGTPLYHTRYETYRFMKMIDPDMKTSAAMTTILVDVIRNLADAVILPFDVNDYLIDLRKSVQIVEDTLFTNNSTIEKKYKEGLQKGIEKVEEAIAKFTNVIATVDKNNPLAVRRVNDKLVAMEKVFIDSNGLPDRPNFKHLLRSPGSINYYRGSSFPGVMALYDVYIKNETETNRRQLEKHLSVIINTLFSIVKLLGME